jgi:hypothetical protein
MVENIFLKQLRELIHAKADDFADCPSYWHWKQDHPERTSCAASCIITAYLAMTEPTEL